MREVYLSQMFDSIKRKLAEWKRQRSSIEELRGQYNKFLGEIGVMLNDLQRALKDSKGYQDVRVDYHDEALERIEAYYGDVVKHQERPPFPRDRMEWIIVAYFGEALIARAGGEWALSERPEDMGYGTPMVVGWGTQDGNMAFYPVLRRDQYAKNSEPFLRDMIDYCVNKVRIETELLGDV